MEVKTIDIFELFEVSITSLSFFEPPGWIIEEILYFLHNSTASAKGKKPSDARTSFWLWILALLRAILTESILLVCPPQIPVVDLFFAITIALEFTNLQTLNAKMRSSYSLLVGIFMRKKPFLGTSIH